jgi:methionyl-tRNA synthetase
MGDIDFADFQKLDIRVGTVVKAEVPSWSHWVMKLTVDLGPEIGKKIIFAGIMHFYKPEDLEGKQIPFVVNLKPKKIGPEGDYSQGMMLAASPTLDPPLVIGGEEVSEKPVLLSLSERVPNGTKVR